MKIRIVRDSVLLAAAGRPIFSNAARPDLIIFSATAIAADFLATYDLRNGAQPHLAALGNMLCRRLRSVVAPSALQVDSTGIVFQLIVAQCTANGAQRLSVLRVTNFASIQFLAAAEAVEGLRDGVPRCYGNVMAINSIKNDARFVGLRSNPNLARFYAPPRGRANVRPAEAVAFIRAITRVSAAILPMIDSSENHVGADVDVGLLPNRGRFRWLYRDRLGERSALDRQVVAVV